MNLFVESLAGYLKQEWDKAFTASENPKEALFILQSLSPENAFALFAELEEHRQQWLQQQPLLQCHFRVAAGLWQDWQASTPVVELDKAMARLGGLGSNGDRLWIDEADRLTYYRNLQATGDQALVVVLLGFNHASDQGGQADFHRVDEQRLWQQAMEQRFIGWVRRLCERYAPESSETDIERFDEIIQQLFKTRSRQLDKLSEFLTIIANGGQDIASLGDLLERFYWHLPFWGIPPLRMLPNEKKTASFLKEADVFISHQRFKSPSEQKKVWGKLCNAFAEGRLELPEEVYSESGQLFLDTKTYQTVLHSFIFNAEAEARNKLLQADLLPVLKILKGKEDKPPSTPEKPLRLSGLSIDVMLQAVWYTLQEFKDKKLGKRKLADVLAKVNVVVKSFSHDLSADTENGQDGKELAKELLLGCLGGLDKVFTDMDWRVPIDDEQAFQLTDHWEKTIPLALDLKQITYGTSRSRPHVKLSVELEYLQGEAPILDGNDNETERLAFRKVVIWAFGPTQPERVRFQCAQSIVTDWQQTPPEHWFLPAFQMPATVMTALYFAADEDEANRLVAQALSERRIIDLLNGLDGANVHDSLRESVRQLMFNYRAWLDCYVKNGYYAADAGFFNALTKAYLNLAERVFDSTLVGSTEILRRFYKAFLLVDDTMQPNAEYLSSAVAWGLTPAVIELVEARTCFLRNGFSEIVSEWGIGRDGKTAFCTLLGLAKIHRPLAGLVVDANRTLSAEIKTFGFLHCLGKPGDLEKSLAVQTLLREEDNDDADRINELLSPSEESSVVQQVLEDYVQFYPFANDGLRIIALHVDDLASVLSGIYRFLRTYLDSDKCAEDWPAFHCTVTVYSTASSPMVTEKRLADWREHVLEKRREHGRPLRLAVGHRYAPNRKRMEEFLRQESRCYDVAFLFHFLGGSLIGQIEPTKPFQFDYRNISRFPICEYPRPIQQGNVYCRQSLLSNRRLRMQTRHGDLSAKLHPLHNSSTDHLLFGQVDYTPWQTVVEALHQKAQWVACIDPFVDKHMLCGKDPAERRKIVGFASGLGDYGELNLSVSTEQDTLSRLTELVKWQLNDLLPLQSSDNLDGIAAQVVGESEEIIGLSSLHAVVGKGEKIREVIGFAAIRRALAKSSAEMSQLLPIDALLHWLPRNQPRPDLLSLSLSMREDDLPLVEVVVIECKFGQHNPVHLDKASEQVSAGLSHLTQLFAPNRPDIDRMSFDRRYWWAQLQRAITSRCIVHLSDPERGKLDQALEALAEGYYEIAWQAAIFTFWTDEPGPEPIVQALRLPANTLTKPFQVPEDFAVWHLALGYQGLAKLFSKQDPHPLITLRDKSAIRVRPVVDQKDSCLSQTSELESNLEKHNPTIPPDEELKDLSKLPASDVSLASNVLDISQQPDDDFVQTLPLHAELEAFPDSEVITPSLTAVPERLLIGTRSNGDPVYWHYGHPQLNNRHLLIFGASGSGKTYGIQCLLAEMAAQGLHSLIIDYTDGFLPQQVEPRFREIAKPQNHLVITDKLPLNPFRRQTRLIDPSMPIIEETSYQVACRVASIFSSIFETMGDQQFATLIRALEIGIEGVGFTLDALPDRLRADGSYGETLANKLEPLIRSKPFREGGDSAWEKMLAAPQHWVQILQLSGLSREIQKLVTEFALWDLYDYACSNGSQYRPIPIVLDEIQNLDHRSDSPIDKMLREGRKFGLSLILATQTTSQFNQEQRDRLFQAGHKLFFKPADTEISRFAELLSQKGNLSKNDWGQRLASLQKGQCWSLGPVLTSSGALKEEAFLVSVSAFEQRQLGK